MTHPAVHVQEARPALQAVKDEGDEEPQNASAAAFSLEGAAAPAASGVGTSDPVADFASMLKHDKLSTAFSSMPKAVETLVNNSMGDRYSPATFSAQSRCWHLALAAGRVQNTWLSCCGCDGMSCMPVCCPCGLAQNLPCLHCRNYEKAASALKAMRAGAIQHSKSENFNNTLKYLRTLFESSQQHKNFWQLLMVQRITLISDDEAPGSGISAAEAADFLEHPVLHAQACSLFPVDIPGH